MQEARRKLFSLFVCTNFQLHIFRYRPIVVVSKKLRYVHVGKQTFRLLDGATLFVFEPSACNLFGLSYAIYLYQNVLRQGLDSHARACGTRYEILSVNLVESSKIAHIGKETYSLDYLVHTATACFEHCGKIFAYLMSLLLYRRSFHRVGGGVDSNLSRSVDGAVHYYSLRIWSYRLWRVVS